jgi:hypothetical protein
MHNDNIFQYCLKLESSQSALDDGTMTFVIEIFFGKFQKFSQIRRYSLMSNIAFTFVQVVQSLKQWKSLSIGFQGIVQIGVSEV